MKEKTSQKYKTAGSRNKTNERNVALLKKIPNFSVSFKLVITTFLKRLAIYFKLSIQYNKN